MKRVTLNQLASYEEDERGWLEHLVGQVYNGNLSHVKETLDCLSKRETLKVIGECVNILDEGEYSDCLLHKDSVRKLYKYAYNSLYYKLTR